MLQKKNPGARIESIFWKKYGRLRTLVSVSISKGIFDRYARLSLFKTHIPSSFIAVRRYSGRPPQCNVLPPLPPASLLPICFALPVLCLHNSSPYELTTHTHIPSPIHPTPPRAPTVSTRAPRWASVGTLYRAKRMWSDTRELNGPLVQTKQWLFGEFNVVASDGSHAALRVAKCDRQLEGGVVQHVHPIVNESGGLPA